MRILSLACLSAFLVAVGALQGARTFRGDRRVAFRLRSTDEFAETSLPGRPQRRRRRRRAPQDSSPFDAAGDYDASFNDRAADRRARARARAQQRQWEEDGRSSRRWSDDEPQQRRRAAQQRGGRNERRSLVEEWLDGMPTKSRRGLLGSAAVLTLVWLGLAGDNEGVTPGLEYGAMQRAVAKKRAERQRGYEEQDWMGTGAYDSSARARPAPEPRQRARPVPPQIFAHVREVETTRRSLADALDAVSASDASLGAICARVRSQPNLRARFVKKEAALAAGLLTDGAQRTKVEAAAKEAVLAMEVMEGVVDRVAASAASFQDDAARGGASLGGAFAYKKAPSSFVVALNEALSAVDALLDELPRARGSLM